MLFHGDFLGSHECLGSQIQDKNNVPWVVLILSCPFATTSGNVLRVATTRSLRTQVALCLITCVYFLFAFCFFVFVLPFYLRFTFLFVFCLFIFVFKFTFYSFINAYFLFLICVFFFYLCFLFFNLCFLIFNLSFLFCLCLTLLGHRTSGPPYYWPLFKFLFL